MARSAVAYLQRSDEGSSAEQALRAGSEPIEVVAIVCDEHRPGRGGLAEALARIAAGEASTLAAARLGVLAGSFRELVALLDWLAAAGADLIALDVGLDTASAAGQRTIAVLREIERWQREPEPGRSPRGRPGLAARAPEVSARIAALREREMSLQAIADELNADGVPTPRGGALWRPSSVQAALGYRRPRPPVPGAPPSPPPHTRSSHPPAHPPPAPSSPRRPGPADRGRPRP